MERNKRAYQEKTDAELTCSICLDDFKNSQDAPVVELNCKTKHVFHQGCLQKWMQTKQSCPFCREEIDLSVPKDEDERV